MEHTTIESVFSFIDDTPIKTLDTLELKSRIKDMVQGEREKAIDEVFDFLKTKRDGRYMKVGLDDLEIRTYKEQMKGGK